MPAESGDQQLLDVIQQKYNVLPQVKYDGEFITELTLDEFAKRKSKEVCQAHQGVDVRARKL